MRSFIVLLTFLVLASTASAALIEFPFADFQGTVTLDPSNGTYYNNQVFVTSYTSVDGVTHNSANSTDPLLGQSLNGNAFDGFHYNPATNRVTADATASFDFYIGDGDDYYLEAKARDLQIVSQDLDGGQYLYTASVNLYDQIYHHTTDSLFMAEYMATSSPTNPQGQIFTWNFIIPLDGSLLVNVSGKLSPIAPVPLPGAVWLLAGGLGGLGFLQRRKNR